jgi:hypothetical protein
MAKMNKFVTSGLDNLIIPDCARHIVPLQDLLKEITRQQGSAKSKKSLLDQSKEGINL